MRPRQVARPHPQQLATPNCKLPLNIINFEMDFPTKPPGEAEMRAMLENAQVEDIEVCVEIHTQRREGWLMMNRIWSAPLSSIGTTYKISRSSSS